MGNIVFGQNEDCISSFKNVYSFVLKEYCSYENNMSDENLFYMVSEIKYDTTNCLFKFVLSRDEFYNELEKLNGNLYYIIDSNLIIVEKNSENIKSLIDNKLDTINANVLKNYEASFLKMDTTKLYSNDYFGINVEFRNGRIFAYEGNYSPIMIFEKYNWK